MGILKRAKNMEMSSFLKRANKKANAIEALDLETSKLSDNKLQHKTVEFKERLVQGETMDAILVEAFAVCREASHRILGMKHYPVQLVGGIALHEGNIAEMPTGEGKTLVATLPAYLNALSGKGVHVVTVNDYLAERDYEQMSPLYEFLGLTTGVITGDMEPDMRRERYQADITYITNTELGFDFLRDNMVLNKEDKVQRNLDYCIVDEVDSVLLDDARTPLIISGGGEEPSNLYTVTDVLVRKLRIDKDFKKDEESKQVWLLDEGIDRIEKFFRLNNFAGTDAMTIRFHVEKSLYCHQFMELDRDYIIRNGDVLIVDQGTGRISEGRRFSNGLHQSLEAKSGVEIKKESQTLATITYQNFFLLYSKISGMTGTAKTEEVEFREIYNLSVFQIPTNRPSKRIDLEDKLYLSSEAKFNAIVQEVEHCISTGQPVLIGTSSIEKSEYLSDKLTGKGIEHVVLNAKNHSREASIIANAGQQGVVTIATNMAGRGTDIKLGEGVRELGGLKIIGSERSENRRVDNQLRGRSGRQGDDGASQFYLSFDDDLLRIFSPPTIKARLKKLVQDENAPIENRFLLKSIKSSQEKLEGTHYDQRKETIKYDSINNEQRVKLYEQRSQLLEETVAIIPVLKEATRNWITTVFEDNFDPYQRKRDSESFKISAETFYQNLTENGIPLDFDKLMTLEGSKEYQLTDWVLKEIGAFLDEREVALNDYEELLRIQTLQLVDSAWTDHLEVLTELKESVRFASYKQEKPEREYLNLSLLEFNKMSEYITSTLAQLFVQSGAINEDGVEEEVA